MLMCFDITYAIYLAQEGMMGSKFMLYNFFFFLHLQFSKSNQVKSTMTSFRIVWLFIISIGVKISTSL